MTDPKGNAFKINTQLTTRPGMRSDNSFLKEYFLFTAYLDHKKVFGLFGIPCGIKRHNHKTTFFKQNLISPTVCMYQCLVSSNGSLVKSRPEAPLRQ